jgi:CubicO group peptidase (beta-lactamase class C family)
MLRTIDRRSFLAASTGFGLTALFGGQARALATLAASDRRSARFEEMLNGYVASGALAGVAGSLGYGVGQAEFFAAGTLSRESETPVDADSLFRIMSMSKPVTGMAVMMLIEDGKIGLDQDLADFVPGFANPRVLTDPTGSMKSRPAKGQITIRHLLTHTSGLGYFSRIQGPLRDEYIRLGLVPVQMDGKSLPDVPGFAYAPNLGEFAERLATLPVLADPGTYWRYSMSPDLLGRVIEIASGTTFEAFLEQRIFSPLGMTSTFFTVPKSEAHRMTSLYGMREGRADVMIDPGRSSVHLEPPPFAFGGSGLLSSARDYDRFLLMLAGEGAIGTTRVMRRETARLAMNNLLPSGVDMSGALVSSEGFGALGSVALSTQPDGKGPGTFGWSGGAGTTCFVDPSRRIRAAGYGQFIPAPAIPFREDIPKAIYGIAGRSKS